jgi:uncharacterized protein (DUF1684 family)
MNKLTEFRKSKDEFFKNEPDSPLTDEQKKAFKGLCYFPENPNLKFSVKVEEFPVKGETLIQTSKGDVQEYQRYGRFTFEVNGEPATLTLYTSETSYFLPFVDSLAGKETYPAGRYLDVEHLGGGKFEVDFNYAYNPYCAYNDRWSCPLTPFENRLKVPIKAGEKKYHE